MAGQHQNTNPGAGPKRPALSCVIPCYNEEEALDQMLERLLPICERCFGDDFEIVLINDGSRDATWQRITDAANRDERIVGIDLSRNHGHQLALSAGLSLCRGERVLVLDADLQDPPELLPDMLSLLAKGADVVYGQRTQRRGESRYKKATAKVFYRLLTRLSDVPIPVDAGDFRLMRRPVVDALNAMPETHRFIRGMVAWLGFNQVPLAYERDARIAGETKYPTARMLRLALDAITGFSVRPLRLSLYLGLFVIIIAIGLILYTLGGLITGAVVPGWMSLMCTVLFIGATQLIMLGIMGEYIGRIFVESKSRPLYTISSVYRSQQNEPPEIVTRSIDAATAAEVASP